MLPFRRPVEAASIQRIRAALRSALSDAVNEQLIEVNPAKLVKLPSGKRPKPLVWTDARVAAWHASGQRPGSVMVWTAPQTQAFLARAARHRLFSLYLIIAYCGLRRGEACGLRWQDVGFKGETLTIAQQIVQIGWDTDIGDTKTDAGERTVAFPKSVRLALNERRLAADREQLDFGPEWADTGLVFTNLG
jgi:integrase